MDLQEFISKFSDQFEGVDLSQFSADTEFKKLEEWTSLVSLSVISMIDEEYGVSIRGKDVREAKTIKDLFDIVESRVE
jgi:acyl carrier protein